MKKLNRVLTLSLFIIAPQLSFGAPKNSFICPRVLDGAIWDSNQDVPWVEKVLNLPEFQNKSVASEKEALGKLEALAQSQPNLSKGIRAYFEFLANSSGATLMKPSVVLQRLSDWPSDLKKDYLKLLIATAQTSRSKPQLSRSEVMDQASKKIGFDDHSIMLKYLMRKSSEPDSKIQMANDHVELDAEQLGPVGEGILTKLNQLVVGNEAAKVFLAKAVQRASTGTATPGKPVAVAMFMGITGSGKTLMAGALAEALTGKPEALTLINAAELQEDHEIAKLTGSPSGYTGHGEGENLVSNEKLKANTSPEHHVNVVLVDEIEKGSDALLKILLGITERGEMTDGTNQVVDFSHSIIIFTSNLGQAEMEGMMNQVRNPFGFQVPSESLAQGDSVPTELDLQLEVVAHQALAQHFSPELRNRIGGTFIFKKMTAPESEQALNMILASAQRRSFFKSPNSRILFMMTPQAKTQILKMGYSPEFGGRSIRRAVDQMVIDPLTNLLSSGQGEPGDVIQIDLNSNTNRFTFIKKASQVPEDQLYNMYRIIYGPEVPLPAKGWIHPDLVPATPKANGQSPHSEPPQNVGHSVSPEEGGAIRLEFADMMFQARELFGQGNQDAEKARQALDKIEHYVLMTPHLSDAEFLQILQALPKKYVPWGFTEGTLLNQLLQHEGLNPIGPLGLETTQMVILFYALAKINYLENPKTFKQSQSIASGLLSDYIQKRQLDFYPRVELRNLLALLYQKALKLS